MPSPSTPRTARSVSESGTPVLTPGRKIKAILAAFDSDSEPDNGSSNQRTIRKSDETMNDAESEEDDDDDIVMPKGRLAARMQAQNQTSTSPPVTGKTAFDRVSKFLRAEREHSKEGEQARHESASASEDEDDLPTAGPRRRRNARKTPEPGEDNTSRSPSRARSFSPLFMSSPAPQRNDALPKDEADDDDEEDLKADPRVRALIMQKRKEREERERLEAEKKAARLAQRDQFSSEIASVEDSDGEEGGRKLTQKRPAARKASKKALEEMNRETQRISRNMQLAHQAQTKKKITKESFFARFNFMQQEESNVAGQTGENSSTTAGSQQSSDNEAQKAKETPQTSPVLGPSDKLKSGEAVDESNKEGGAELEEEDFPTVDEMLSRSQGQPQQVTVGRVEVKGNDNKRPVEPAKPERKALTQPPIRVRLSRQSIAQNQQEDSEDDLEVVTDPAKCRRIAAFENLPAKKMQESASMLKLKALAHLTSPTRRSKTMNTAELSAMLLFQARQQAAKERQERIQELRAKGVIIETAEERAALEDELENLVEKARQEAEEIAKKERGSKNKKREDGDDDEDEDFELSGSDQEGYGDGEGDDEEEEEDEDDEEHEQGVIDSEAGEDEESEDEQTEVMSADESEVPAARRKRPTRVISDDEDEDEPQAPQTPAKPTHSTVNSVERPQFPGMTSDGLTMSLTQAFAGTLGASQPVTQAGSPAIPNSLPDPAQITHNRRDSDSQIIIKDSQEQRAESTDILAGYSHSETRVSESPAPRAMSQFSQIPDPTQDAGFVLSPFDPSKRFLETPHSTIETVLVGQNESRNNTPVPDRRAKHLRRGRAANLSMIEEQDEGGFEIDASAFDVMKKAAKKKTHIPFDPKTSKAKEVVEDAAEESDDEYAGLGGASDDSEDEEDAYDRQMINDNSGETVDEKQLAALNALHQRNADEKQVAKLLKDITTGALRRRRHGDDEFDLDDSDDELLARRRQKQREFARMRKALLADEKIGEIAENPKKAAFFKAIEDRDSDDDIGLEFLDDEQDPGSQEDSSQGVASDAPQQHSAADESNKRKRALEPSAEDINNRPPPHLRRKQASAISKKPATLAEIRETVSFLTETPEYDSFHEDASIDDVDEAQNDDEDDSGSAQERPKETFAVPGHPRRTRGPVVDRLALLRQASSNSATSASSSNRLAFFAGGGNDLTFRPPPMLRKTTTSSSSSSTSSKLNSSKRVTKPAVGASVAKKGAVNYYTAAREREREREIRAKDRSGGSNITALLNKHASNRLGSLGGTGRWE
ncbi:mediator of replication checkpoint protein 1 [Aspergillus udagawae]|nr:mediator of replication checkpoint protein 1 [Aspergillus udagawae]